MLDALFLYSKTRSLSFWTQYALLDFLARRVSKSKAQSFHFDKTLVQQLNRSVSQLLKEDIKNIRSGLYPASVLKPQSPLLTALNFPRVIWDSLTIHQRRTRGQTTKFGKKAKKYLNELPKYYQRNFHFQTDGYLSDQSAAVYEFEVELLFSGTADAMRRLSIAPIRRKFSSKDGEGLKILELGCGTGRATKFLKLAFPKARILGVDLSVPYLNFARDRLKKLDQIDLLQADAAHLPFKSGEFDVVVSTFLFHELPEFARREVIQESFRVLKKKGLLLCVDSIQKGDQVAADPLLEQFPKDFHEPFYRNYIHSPLEKLVKEVFKSPVQTKLGFLSKAVWASR